MTVDPNTAVTYDHAGVTYRFCSDHCRDTFTANPDDFSSRHTPADAA